MNAKLIIILISLIVEGISFTIKHNNNEEYTNEKHMCMLTHEELDVMQQVQDSIKLIGNSCKDTDVLPIRIDGFGNFMIRCNPYPLEISIIKSNANYISTNDADNSRYEEYPLALLKIQTEGSRWSTKILTDGNIMIKGPATHTKASGYWVYKPKNGKLFFHTSTEVIPFKRMKNIKKLSF